MSSSSSDCEPDSSKIICEKTEIMSRSGSELSDLSYDVLSEIIYRLENVEFIRSGAVCRTWRNFPGRKYCNKPQIPLLMLSSHDKDKIPWLMLSSRDKVEHRYFYSIVEKKKYDIHLPDISGRHCFGSSQGFLISVDDNADLHATNPLTGTHLPLPPTVNSPYFKGVISDPNSSTAGKITHYIRTDPDYKPTPALNIRDYHYNKVILSPSRDVAVAIYGAFEDLAFARVGGDSWTYAIDRWPPHLAGSRIACFTDAIFHKSRLHAINFAGDIAIFDDLNNPTFVSLEGPLARFDHEPRRHLVESPDGEDLFLVHKETDGEDRPTTVRMRVFLLDKATYKWERITTLGDVALFVGFNHSMSLCTRKCPGLKRNSVYFTDDNKTKPEDAADMGVFNLEDGRIESIYVDSDLHQLDWPRPIWFMPTQT